VKSALAFTLIDAARRGVILGKVQNYFNRIRLGNPTVDFIARSQRLVQAETSSLVEAMLV
jgi:hypothetical protein